MKIDTITDECTSFVYDGVTCSTDPYAITSSYYASDTSNKLLSEVIVRYLVCYQIRYID